MFVITTVVVITDVVVDFVVTVVVAVVVVVVVIVVIVVIVVVITKLENRLTKALKRNGSTLSSNLKKIYADFTWNDFFQIFVWSVSLLLSPLRYVTF